MEESLKRIRDFQQMKRRFCELIDDYEQKINDVSSQEQERKKEHKIDILFLTQISNDMKDIKKIKKEYEVELKNKQAIDIIDALSDEIRAKLCEDMVLIFKDYFKEMNNKPKPSNGVYRFTFDKNGGLIGDTLYTGIIHRGWGLIQKFLKKFKLSTECNFKFSVSNQIHLTYIKESIVFEFNQDL